jgi:hypothetical protein
MVHMISDRRNPIIKNVVRPTKYHKTLCNNYLRIWSFAHNQLFLDS